MQNPIRVKILENKMRLPYYEQFVHKVGKPTTVVADHMFRAMWRAYLDKGKEGTINLCYWADRFLQVCSPDTLNAILMTLANANIIETRTAAIRNWAEGNINENWLLEHVTQDELMSVRVHNKFRHYIMDDEESDVTQCDIVRVNGKEKRTGLSTPATQLTGNIPFKFDTEKMAEYRHLIERNVTKGMDKMAELVEFRSNQATYDTISRQIVEYYLENDGQYRRGQSYLDSRGRAISESLSKVGNPIGYKDFRALIQLPTF